MNSNNLVFQPEIYYFVISLIIIFLIFKFYNKSCEYYTNKVVQNKLLNKIHNNKSENQTNAFKANEPLNIKRTLAKNEIKQELSKCISKIREKSSQDIVKSSVYGSNNLQFNLKDMKNDKDDNNIKLLNTKKMARLNCEYFDLNNDLLNKSLLPQHEQLFIT
jgi:hypothetical protein